MLAQTTLTWTKLFWLKWSNKFESCHNWTIKRPFWLTPCWHNSRHESIKHSLSGVFCWFVISSKNHRPSDGINWYHESWMVYHILKIETLFSSQRWIDFLPAWRYDVLFSTVSGLTLSCMNHVQFQPSSSQFNNFSWFWLSVIHCSTLALLFARVLDTGYSPNIAYYVLFYKRFFRRKIIMVGANQQKAEYNTIHYWSSKIVIIHQLNLAFGKSWILLRTQDISWVLPLFSIVSARRPLFSLLQCNAVV